MNAKLKTHLIGLAISLGFVAVGFGLGEPPAATHAFELPAPVLAQAEAPAALDQVVLPSRPASRGALKRHLAMPYVSIAAFLPRQES